MASTYVHNHVKVGDVLDVSAPRGSFTLHRMIGPLFCSAPALEPLQFSRCSTRWRWEPRHAKFGGYMEPVTETTTRLLRSHVNL